MRKEHFQGIILLISTAIIWVVSSFISEALVSTNQKNEKAAINPLQLTYFGTSFFAIYLPFLLAKHTLDGISKSKQGHYHRVSNLEHNEQNNNILSNISVSIIWQDFLEAYILSDDGKKAFKAAFMSFLPWFTAQWAFNESLKYTSVTSNSIISSTSSLFTYVLSVYLIHERFTLSKLGYVILSIIGVTLVTLSDRSDENLPSAFISPVLGDALAVSSAALYGLYTVIMRKYMPTHERREFAMLLLGYIGVFNLVGTPTIFLVKRILMGDWGFEHVAPSTFLVIMTEGLVDYVLSDYLWILAVMLLSPTIATLGLAIQIPIASTIELALGRAAWARRPETAIKTVVGTTVILISFVLINLKEDRSKRERGEEEMEEDDDQEFKKENEIKISDFKRNIAM